MVNKVQTSESLVKNKRCKMRLLLLLSLALLFSLGEARQGDERREERRRVEERTEEKRKAEEVTVGEMEEGRTTGAPVETEQEATEEPPSLVLTKGLRKTTR